MVMYNRILFRICIFNCTWLHACSQCFLPMNNLLLKDDGEGCSLEPSGSLWLIAGRVNSTATVSHASWDAKLKGGTAGHSASLIVYQWQQSCVTFVAALFIYTFKANICYCTRNKVSASEFEVRRFLKSLWSGGHIVSGESELKGPCFHPQLKV